MKRIFTYLKQYTKEAILAPTFKLLEAIFDLIVPIVVAYLIDNGVSTGDNKYIFKMTLILLGLGILGLGCSIVAQYFSAKAAVLSCGAMREDLFKKIESFDYEELDKQNSSTLITRMTSDINQVQIGINLSLRLLLRSPFIVFGAMIMAFVVNKELALSFAVVIPILGLVVFLIMTRCISLYKKTQGEIDNLTEFLRDNLRGVRVLRAFNKEQDEIDDFYKKNGALVRIEKYTGRISSLLNPITIVLVNLAICYLIYKGVIKIGAGTLSSGKLIALYNYMSQILVELIKLANLIISITKALASSHRIDAVLSIVDAPNGNIKELKDKDTIISLNNVSYSFEEAKGKAISNLSIDIKRGETIGIIGGTGAGKTVLVHLIGGFYKSYQGHIKFNDVEVNSIDNELLNSKVSISPQKSVLFKGTIKDNLLWGDENASDEKINKYIEIGQAIPIIEAKSDGLNHEVEQEGRNFSGGEKQRLSVVRALIKEADILILDDSTSALDYMTEKKLKNALKNMEYKPTTILASDRVSSVRDADRIIVLENGEAVAIGKHEELLEISKIYYDFYKTQYLEDHE